MIALPIVSTSAMRSMQAGDTRLFQRRGSADDRLVTSYATRVDGRFRQKVLILLDPVTLEASKVLAVTRED